MIFLPLIGDTDLPVPIIASDHARSNEKFCAAQRLGPGLGKNSLNIS